MEDDYLNKIKMVQDNFKELKTYEDLLKEKRKQLDYVSTQLTKIGNFKSEYIKECRKLKEENYNLFTKGVKHCLCCGNIVKEENIRWGTFNLNSPCRKCGQMCWLVGNNYPCEICNRIMLNPRIHHINGNKKINEIDNLIFICEDCHQCIHHGIPTTRAKRTGKKHQKRSRTVKSYGSFEIDLLKKYREIYLNKKYLNKQNR